MDLLAQRYASPFLILDEFIRLHQLHEFTVEVLTSIAEEKAHQSRWDVWLHKVWNMDYAEYVRRCRTNAPEDQGMTNEQIGNVINDSKTILDGFVPE